MNKIAENSGRREGRRGWGIYKTEKNYPYMSKLMAGS
jgi:hypothetical protein